ncbi:MAG: class I mannose-6-phosphate isomerase, partial [Ardenticatenaceae bacterium]
MVDAAWRQTTQELLPAVHRPMPAGQYDVYGSFPVGSGKIALGYEALADQLLHHKRVVIDGYGGILWHNFKARLDHALAGQGVRA